MRISMQFFGGRGSSSATSGGAGISVPSNATVLASVNDIPTKLKANQRLITLDKSTYDISYDDGKTWNRQEFEEFGGKDTYGDKDANIVAQNAGYKTSNSYKKNYAEHVAASQDLKNQGVQSYTQNNGTEYKRRLVKFSSKPVLVTLK